MTRLCELILTIHDGSITRDNLRFHAEIPRESFSAAVAAAEWNPQQDFYQLLTNPPGQTVWPITGTVFVLMPRAPGNAVGTRDALAFFQWALMEGQADALAEHYVALPQALVMQIRAYWSATFK